MSNFDNQANFDFYIPQWNDMYSLCPGPSSTLSTIDRPSVNIRLDEFISIIKFWVFAHEYKREYIGTLENLDQAAREAVAQVEKNLRLINMTYKCPQTGDVMERKPDTVYESMM